MLLKKVENSNHGKCTFEDVQLLALQGCHFQCKCG